MRMRRQERNGYRGEVSGVVAPLRQVAPFGSAEIREVGVGPGQLNRLQELCLHRWASVDLGLHLARLLARPGEATPAERVKLGAEVALDLARETPGADGRAASATSTSGCRSPPRGHGPSRPRRTPSRPPHRAPPHAGRPQPRVGPEDEGNPEEVRTLVAHGQVSHSGPSRKSRTLRSRLEGDVCSAPSAVDERREARKRLEHLGSDVVVLPRDRIEHRLEPIEAQPKPVPRLDRDAARALRRRGKID